MTIKTTVFSQDKRVTNDAMRIVRGCFPNIGPAYSDKRWNGRRYKFVQWGHKRAITPAVVAELNKLFAVNNVRAKAYLHVSDGRTGYGPGWDGHLCIRTYDESNIKSNNTNTTPIMKSKKSTTTNITANDITTVITAALDQYLRNNQSGKSTQASEENEEEIFTFTGEELIDFVRKIATNVSGQCLDNIKAVTVDQDSEHVSFELIGNEIHMDVDMEGVADDLEASFEDIVDYIVEDDSSIVRWYEGVKK